MFALGVGNPYHHNHFSSFLTLCRPLVVYRLQIDNWVHHSTPGQNPLTYNFACWHRRHVLVGNCYLFVKANYLTCFLQLHEVKQSVKKDVFILGHSSTFPFTYWILASVCVIFYHNFCCSSPAFGVVVLRSSHIRALSHGSPTKRCRKPLATTRAAKYSSYWML